MTGTVLASAPGECCMKFVQHEGTPVGSTITLGGLKSYISHPANKSNDKIAMVFTNVFGPFFVNNQLLMDYFASHGYLVVAPDYLDGEYIQDVMDEPDFDIMGWVTPKRDRAEVITPAWIDAVMKELGTEKTQRVTVGYCFGGPFVMNLCVTEKIKAGAIAHPTLLDEDHFRRVKQPILVSCAEEDFTFPMKARHRSEEILAEIKAKYHYQLFSGVEHGFAVRGDMGVVIERWAKEECARSVVEWWNRFMD